MTVVDDMMNSSSAPKVRLVECPKCRKVLGESVDIPIYKCGGCGIILQAKHRKIDSKITGPDQHQLPHKESNNASEDKDSGSLTRDVPVPSSAENSVELEEARDQNMSINSEHFMPKEEMSLCADRDQLGRNNHRNAEDNGERDEKSSGIRSSTELKSPENGDMMNSSSAPKGRLVKCPKCQEVLRESVDIPIYKGGGCGIILRAKHRKIDSKITGPDQHQLPHKESSNASGGRIRDRMVEPPAQGSKERFIVRDMGTSFGTLAKLLFS